MLCDVEPTSAYQNRFAVHGQNHSAILVLRPRDDSWRSDQWPKICLSELVQGSAKGLIRDLNPGPLAP